MTDLALYRDRLGEIGDETAERVVALREHEDLAVDEFALAAATVIMVGKARASTLADLTLAAYLADRRGRDVAPVGVGVPASEERRLRLAVTGVLEEHTEGSITVHRLTRLGRAEPLTSAQDAWATAGKRHRLHGWTRGTAGGCPICRDLANGVVLSWSTPMVRHKNCRCVQEPA